MTLTGAKGRAPWTWEPPLERGVLRSRYKRFLADVEFPDGRVETVHCPNSGSMSGMKTPGSDVVVSYSDKASRRLRRTLELVQVDDGDGPTWVGVNTMRPNAWAASAIAAGLVPGVRRAGSIQREVQTGNSRLDLLVTTPRGRLVWVEVKNTTLAARARDGVLEAQFPDAVTTRGRRHLDALEKRVEAGDQAIVLFLVNRGDAGRFRAADTIDPQYREALWRARDAGVGVAALQVSHRVQGRSGSVRVVTGWKVPLPLGRAPACKRVISPQS